MVKKIIIINGNSKDGPEKLNLFLKELQLGLVENGKEVNLYNLVNEDIHYCIGCWNCWWKTPGLCRYEDSMHKILPKIIHSNLVIYSSPMIMGFYSSLLKKFQDRTIPLVHPYIEYVNNESHHHKRYPVYPKIGVVLDTETASSEEVELARQIFGRFALNFKSEVSFCHSLSNITIKDLVYEAGNI
ncbi:hypothetical protein MNBD_BACTEROID01-2898 [hydrothermal vent metagenome]|uniref:NADPH-dependent FMN reductase-like domain-containing protein n=1 Tax=hydrothermal vent metagenome TaxID=652676 RepID=A0A3B0U8W2_9ZZZZ